MEEMNIENQKEQKSMLREIIEWVLVLVIAASVAFFIRQFIMTVVKVDGESMANTLHNKEHLIAWRLGYEPDNGDIIIFEPDCAQGSYYVKRVIATEGQSVEIDYEENAVYVDGMKIEEPYIKEEMLDRSYFGGENSWVVPDDSVFVLGDNRNNSRDSRDPSVGYVDKDAILGKVVLRLWPVTKIGLVE
ncbi:MAG: signal peptidase I [Clostridia bacterium]